MVALLEKAQKIAADVGKLRHGADYNAFAGDVIFEFTLSRRWRSAVNLHEIVIFFMV